VVLARHAAPAVEPPDDLGGIGRPVGLHVAAADGVDVRAREPLRDARDPVGSRARVVVGERDDLRGRARDARPQGRGDPALAHRDRVHRQRRTGEQRERRVVVRACHDHDPGRRNHLVAQRAEASRQRVGPPVARDDHVDRRPGHHPSNFGWTNAS
jgi:hypothetical protein